MGESIENLIDMHCDKAGWSKEELIKARSLIDSKFKKGKFSFESPPRDLITLWAIGIVNFTRERGLSLSAAALSKLGVVDETRHRYWTGQTELLLPMIDLFRLRLCDHLTERFGKSWPTNWSVPSSEEELSAVRRIRGRVSGDTFAWYSGLRRNYEKWRACTKPRSS